jgi:hypothetical protein
VRRRLAGSSRPPPRLDSHGALSPPRNPRPPPPPLKRYTEGVATFTATVNDYLRWGRGANAAGGRVIGEASETLRDIFHTEFALGSLVQVRPVLGVMRH